MDSDVQNGCLSGIAVRADCCAAAAVPQSPCAGGETHVLVHPMCSGRQLQFSATLSPELPNH